MARKKAEAEVIKTSEAVRVDGSKRLHTAEMRRRELAQIYKNQRKIPVNISPLYKPHFGDTLTITINGITTVIPCDGKTYHLPQTFATEALARVAKTNEIMERSNKMSDITSNFEQAPGELTL